MFINKYSKPMLRKYKSKAFYFLLSYQVIKAQIEPIKK